MNLDESIELRNKKQNTTEMNTLGISEIRNLMAEIMADENASGCLYEVLTQEGFLSDTLNEGEDYQSVCELMMGDDDILSEMYKACAANVSECGQNLQEWIEGHSPFMREDEYLDDNMPSDFEAMEGQLDQVIHWYMKQFMGADGDNNPEQAKSDVMNSVEQSIQRYLQKNGIESAPAAEPMMGSDEVQHMPVTENKLPAFEPVKGKGVDTENKENATEEDEVKEAEDSQETTEEKVDNLKNQKFSPNMENGYQKEMKNFHLGYKNALNYDYANDVSPAYKERVEREVTTGHSHPRDEKKLGKEANIDAESTKKTGQAMIDASKENQRFADADFQANPLLVTQEPYERTSVTGNNHIFKDKKVNEQIDRMKKMFGYEEKTLNENKRNKGNEDELLFNSVSTKKPI